MEKRFYLILFNLFQIYFVVFCINEKFVTNEEFLVDPLNKDSNIAAIEGDIKAAQLKNKKHKISSEKNWLNSLKPGFPDDLEEETEEEEEDDWQSLPGLQSIARPETNFGGLHPWGGPPRENSIEWGQVNKPSYSWDSNPDPWASSEVNSWPEISETEDPNIEDDIQTWEEPTTEKPKPKPKPQNWGPKPEAARSPQKAEVNSKPSRQPSTTESDGQDDWNSEPSNQWKPKPHPSGQWSPWQSVNKPQNNQKHEEVEEVVDSEEEEANQEESQEWQPRPGIAKQKPSPQTPWQSNYQKPARQDSKTTIASDTPWWAYTKAKPELSPDSEFDNSWYPEEPSDKDEASKGATKKPRQLKQTTEAAYTDNFEYPDYQEWAKPRPKPQKYPSRPYYKPPNVWKPWLQNPRDSSKLEIPLDNEDTNLVKGSIGTSLNSIDSTETSADNRILDEETKDESTKLNEIPEELLTSTEN